MKLTISLLSISLMSMISAMVISIQVPGQWKDSATVVGKNTSEGDVSEMTYASHSTDGGYFCPVIDADNPEDCDRYYEIAIIDFSQPTQAARPINITVNKTFFRYV
jgi:hypothetical protein